MSDITTKVFRESLNKIVLIQLKGGRMLRGKLSSFDQHMNLALEEAEDVSDSENSKKLGTLIVRGDNIVLLSPTPNR
jgi:small nuclear ribonucleoprotein